MAHRGTLGPGYILAYPLRVGPLVLCSYCFLTAGIIDVIDLLVFRDLIANLDPFTALKAASGFFKSQLSSLSGSRGTDVNQLKGPQNLHGALPAVLWRLLRRQLQLQLQCLLATTHFQ